MHKKEILRAFWDYRVYIIKHNMASFFAALIDTIILVLALCNWEQLTKQSSWILLLVFVFVNYIWQIMNIIGHFATYFRSPQFRLEDSAVIKKGAKAEDWGRCIDASMNDMYEQMEELPKIVVLKDYSFLLKDIPIEIVEEKKREGLKQLMKVIWSSQYFFLVDRYKSKKVFVNEKKICMLSEFFSKDNGTTYSVKLVKGEYYDSYLTNEVYNKFLRHRGAGIPLYPVYNVKNYPIPTLNFSLMSNHIGVSTFLITSDGKTYLFVQQHDNNINSGQIVPSGSGSVDYADKKKAKKRGCLRSVICSAAERELKEETGIDPDEIKMTTSIIGYYRDLSRGGKPDFCCVTYVERESGSLTITPSKKELYNGVIICSLQDVMDKKIDILLRDINSEFAPSDTLRANLYFLKKYIETKETERLRNVRCEQK